MREMKAEEFCIAWIGVLHAFAKNETKNAERLASELGEVLVSGKVEFSFGNLGWGCLVEGIAIRPIVKLKLIQEGVLKISIHYIDTSEEGQLEYLVLSDIKFNYTQEGVSRSVHAQGGVGQTLPLSNDATMAGLNGFKILGHAFSIPILPQGVLHMRITR